MCLICAAIYKINFLLSIVYKLLSLIRILCFSLTVLKIHVQVPLQSMIAGNGIKSHKKMKIGDGGQNIILMDIFDQCDTIRIWPFIGNN